MANTILERTRQLHEDIERAERLAAKDLQRTMTRYKDRLQQDHRTKRFLDDIQACSKKLVRLPARPLFAAQPGLAGLVHL